VPPEASTKSHVHRKFENFGTNIASTVACPNFKNGPKIALRPLGVNEFFYFKSGLKTIFILLMKLQSNRDHHQGQNQA
jgi:hypothetical protein